MTGKVAADNYGILTDNLNILPAYFYILISAQKPEAFASAPYYHRYKTATAGVNFHITHTAESAACFSAYDLLVS